MTFKVIDKTTGKEADTYNIALNEQWAKNLVYCDIEGWFIGEDGSLMLADECSNYAYPPDADRFEVVFDEDEDEGYVIDPGEPEEPKPMTVNEIADMIFKIILGAVMLGGLILGAIAIITIYLKGPA
jgi:hypothetical protein